MQSTRRFSTQLTPVPQLFVKNACTECHDNPTTLQSPIPGNKQTRPPNKALYSLLQQLKIRKTEHISNRTYNYDHCLLGCHHAVWWTGTTDSQKPAVCIFRVAVELRGSRSSFIFTAFTAVIRSKSHVNIRLHQRCTNPGRLTSVLWRQYFQDN
jgi:hypothetical protein